MKFILCNYSNQFNPEYNLIEIYYFSGFIEGVLIALLNWCQLLAIRFSEEPQTSNKFRAREVTFYLMFSSLSTFGTCYFSLPCVVELFNYLDEKYKRATSRSSSLFARYSSKNEYYMYIFQSFIRKVFRRLLFRWSWKFL